MKFSRTTIVFLAMMIAQAFFLSSCASVHESELTQLRRDYLNGYYKKAFKRAETLSQHHIKEAEYTLGYLHYYGYGTPQNTEAPH